MYICVIMKYVCYYDHLYVCYYDHLYDHLHTHDYLTKIQFETLVWRLMKGLARNELRARVEVEKI